MPAPRPEHLGIRCPGLGIVGAPRGEIGYDGLTSSFGAGSLEDLTLCLFAGKVPLQPALKKLMSLAKF